MTELYHTVATYIPFNLTRAVVTAENPAPPADYQQHRFPAAVLYADVSGFTPLTEALGQRGSEGPEELTRLLNRYFSWMIAFIEAEGGEVVKFGGDALSVVFRAEEEPLAHATRRALQAAKTMQSAMEEFGIMESSVGLISLRMRFGIGAGELVEANVGGVGQRWEYLIAGDALVQAALSERQALQGEIKLSPQAQAVLYPQDLPPRPLPVIDWKSVKNPAAVEAVLRCFVPIPARIWLGEDLHGWLATLRPMSVLFIGINGLDYTPPDTIERLHHFVRDAQTVIYSLEGSMPRITVDDKGTVMLVLFGAPPNSHEDDPERAVRCALELQALAPRHNMQISGGITAGRVFAGPVGGFTRREYTVMGDTVNLAARLMVVARPDRIRCNYEAFRSSYGQMGFNTLAPVRVKGKTEPIRVYQPTGDYRPGQKLEQIQQTSPFLVGRRAELARLNTHLEAIKDGHSRIVIIEGEAGIGKTQLLKELVQFAPKQQTKVLLGVGRSIDQLTPLRVWREMLNDYLTSAGQVNAALGDLVWEKLQRLDPYLTDYLFLLNDMLGLDLPENALTALLDEPGRYQMIASIVLTLLDAGNLSQPQLLILEDAQWLDAQSWGLAAQMALTVVNNQLPVMLVLVTRPFENPDARQDLAALAALPQTDRLRLDTMPPDDILSLVTAPLGLTSNELPESVAELIRNRAGGNPFFAEEIFYYLHQNGFITFKAMDDATRCLVSDDLNRAAQTLPATIQNVILSRIDLLPPEKQLMLKVAAVIGQSFTHTALRETLRQHLEIAEPQIKLNLDDLTYLGFIVPEPESYHEPSYSFKHIIIREVTYQTLLFDRRRQLHRTVAEWYETTPGTSPDRRLSAIKTDTNPSLTLTRSLPPSSTPLAPFYTLLVYHWHQAEDEDKERHYSALVGEQAVRQFANAEALSYLNRALDLTPAADAANRFKLLLARETVLDRRGDRERQMLDLTRLMQTAQSAQNPAWEALAALRYAQFTANTGQYIEALAAVDQAEAIAAQLGDGPLAGQVWLTRAKLLIKTGHYAEAGQQLHKLDDVFFTPDTIFVEAEALYYGACLNWYAGTYQQARTDAQNALTFARRHSQNLSMAGCQRLLGQIEAKLGRFAAAADFFEQAAANYHTIGYRQGEAQTMVNIGQLQLAQCNFEAARDYFELALDMARDLHDRESMAQAMAGLGDLYCSLGDYTIALGYLGQALSANKEMGNVFAEAETTGKLARIYYHVGDNRTTRRYCELALKIQRKIGAIEGQGYTQIYLGHALTGLGELDAAREAYQRALESRPETGPLSGKIVPKTGLAIVYFAQDQLEPALLLADEVAAWLETNNLRVIEDQGRLALNLYYIFSGAGQEERARRVVDFAHSLLESLANGLTHPKVRYKFLQDVRTNQAIAAIWEGREPESYSPFYRKGSTKEPILDDGPQPA